MTQEQKNMVDYYKENRMTCNCWVRADGPGCDDLYFQIYKNWHGSTEIELVDNNNGDVLRLSEIFPAWLKNQAEEILAYAKA